MPRGAGLSKKDPHPTLSTDASALLAHVRDRYLKSRDFNGLHLHGEWAGPARDPAVELVRAGLIQVVTDSDYMNIHIRPWSSRRTLEDQVQDLVSLKGDDYGVCLYPTAGGMKGVRLPSRMTGHPYDRAMARGKGTLELAYFEFGVLEQYRNDSRFRFAFGDASASMGISDEAYDDDDVFERDHVGLSHIGFAYDLSGYRPADPESPIVRRVAVFYCDLIRLTPEHQRRWETYEVDGANLSPHPLWWMTQMGHWPDGVGPFTRLFMELENLNELALLSVGERMFRTTDRPRDMGWLLRPSQLEWDAFVVQLDKVLSDNLRPQFFDAARVRQTDAEGNRIGTLQRLQLFMESGGVREDEARSVLEPLRNVRKGRQKPAHVLRENITDRTFVHQQIDLLQHVISALRAIRHWLATHPRCSDWEEKHPDLENYIL